jgi:HEAT repeat protein
LRRDASDDVRETAAWALGELHDRSAADALGEAVASDKSEEVRGAAAWALGQIRPQPAPAAVVRAISALLSSPDDGVRTKAAWALSEIGDPAAVPALRAALRQESDALARRAEVRALVHAGEHSDESLGDLLHASDPAVREAAVRGLVGGLAGPWPWPWPRPRPFP